MPLPSRTFYFMRHGRTDANQQGLMCGGEWDIAINELGTEQARGASGLLDLVDPPIDGIFVSPLLRARQTAALVNERCNLPIQVVEGLREWRVGEWEGKPWGEVPNPFNTAEEPPGGEPRKVFEARIEEAVSRTLATFQGVPLFVSHGAAAHALFTVLGVDRLQIENCALYCVEPCGLHWKIHRIG